MILCRGGRDASAKSTCEQPQFRFPHGALHLRREAGDGQKLQRAHHHLSTIISCLKCSFLNGQVCICSLSCLYDPESAKGVLCWPGHLGDVQEEPRALRRVLESCSGDVAEALQLQHGHYSCN